MDGLSSAQNLLRSEMISLSPSVGAEAVQAAFNSDLGRLICLVVTRVARDGVGL